MGTGKKGRQALGATHMDDESNGVLVVQKFLPLLPDAYLKKEGKCSSRFAQLLRINENHVEGSSILQYFF